MSDKVNTVHSSHGRREITPIPSHLEPFIEARSIVKKADAGRLCVVATTIGNLGDLSARARETLQACSVIAAEDTRHTGTLLKAFGIASPLVSLHDYNEAQRIPDLIRR